MGIELPPSMDKRLTEQLAMTAESTLEKALRICGLTKGTAEYKANYDSIGSWIRRVDAVSPGCSVDMVCQFDSEMRQGEMKNVRNPAALLMSRLKAAIEPQG